MYRIVYRRTVSSDLYEIRSFISADTPQAADEIILRILDRIDVLIMQPRLGRPGRVPGTRELVIAGTPFIVPYHLPRPNEIEILAVLHGARRWPNDFSR